MKQEETKSKKEVEYPRRPALDEFLEAFGKIIDYLHWDLMNEFGSFAEHYCQGLRTVRIYLDYDAEGAGRFLGEVRIRAHSEDGQPLEARCSRVNCSGGFTFSAFRKQGGL